MTDIGKRIPLFEKRIVAPFVILIPSFAFGGFLFLSSIGAGMGAYHRAGVALTNASLRNLAVDFETYYIDNSCYPPGTIYKGDLIKLQAAASFSARIFLKPPSYSRRYMPRFAVPALILFFLILTIIKMIWVKKFRISPPTISATPKHAVIIWSTCIIAIVTVPDSLWAIDISAILFYIPAAFFSILWLIYSGIVYIITRYNIPKRAILISLIAPILLALKISQTVIVSSLAESHAHQLRGSDSYMYATDAQSVWILQGTGPDGTYDYDLEEWIELSSIEAKEVYLQAADGVHPEMIFYDPTNGTISDGDIFRSGPD